MGFSWPCSSAFSPARCLHGAAHGSAPWRPSVMSSASPTIGTSPWILEVRDVKKSYENGTIEALRGVSLGIAQGDFLAITGASGSGKSTLLHLLGGLDTPTEGTVLFRGQPIGKSQNGVASIDLDTYRATSAGFIFQSFH